MYVSPEKGWSEKLIVPSENAPRKSFPMNDHLGFDNLYFFLQFCVYPVTEVTITPSVLKELRVDE
jgi:hypothetical protein